jgi:hypothetical protein
VFVFAVSLLNSRWTIVILQICKNYILKFQQNNGVAHFDFVKSVCDSKHVCVLILLALPKNLRHKIIDDLDICLGLCLPSWLVVDMMFAVLTSSFWNNLNWIMRIVMHCLHFQICVKSWKMVYLVKQKTKFKD